ncbi:hypothetical protein [Shewanella sp. SE1]|uniref:hypothetical protein n=1 Tax=Shewanella sp. SE1 TaxID=2705014 RepID=UPI00138F81B9|nr:hypothetical protein [Shewanella sp. SE1]NDO76629.1 hypothetical protein [Shewanella sp. SE1]
MNDSQLLTNEWKSVSDMLGIECVGPFVLYDKQGKKHTFSCHLPQFGGEMGILINNEYEKEKYAIAISQGFSVSTMQPEKHHLPIKPSNYIDCLNDWGWSSINLPKPAWCTNVS